MTSKPKKTLKLPHKTARKQNQRTGQMRSGARAAKAQALTRQRQIIRPAKKITTIKKTTKKSTTKNTRPITATATVSKRANEGSLFTVFAPCPQGLEEVLEKELQQLNYTNIERSRAGCRFKTNWQGILRANLYSRIATRILVQLEKAPVKTPDDIYALALNTEWEHWFGPSERLRVDTSAIGSPMQSLQYCNLKVKDAICDRLRHKEGARPDVDIVRPDAKVHLFLDAHSATLYIDSSGESLFKRGWRKQKGQAPIRENLAAGLLALSGWDGKTPLIDPFCGSGTILIEAAWQALNAPPGLHRPFHFERLRNHNPRIWRTIKEKAQSEIHPSLNTLLIGADVDANAIKYAKENLQLAQLAKDNIQFKHCNALEVMPPTQAGWVVTNPPYGERLDEQEQQFWFNWSSHLKDHYDGWSVNIISNHLDLPRQLRLRPNRRYPVYNGDLDCRLFQFDIHARIDANT